MKPVLEIRDLRAYYHTLRGPVKAVDGVSFDLLPGQRFGLIGESGSGKSTVALSLMRLIRPPGRIESGQIVLDGVDLLGLADEAMRQLRLAKIAMVGLWREVAAMYPHQLSGGMKQRVSIAIAISLRPKLIIADEPTSALDVVVQRHVMQTLRKVVEELDTAVVLIGHDMGLMAQFVDHVGVMYAGRLVEMGPVSEIFAQPQHPYSRVLMESLPSLDRKSDFQIIKDLPPSLLNPPPGCIFHPRCPYVMARCRTEVPPLREVGEKRQAACHLLDEN
jgi:oligopeptide/dipeptide ABC transporter ATP-binding protein